MLNIPILGIANAGRPLALAEQYEYGILPISKSLVSGNEIEDSESLKNF